MKAPRRVSGASPRSTIPSDPGTRSFRRVASSPYGAGGRNERLMAVAGRMSRSLMSNPTGTGLRRTVSGDFYYPGSAGSRQAGNKFMGQATRRGNRVTVAEEAGRGTFTGRKFTYRLTDRPGVRPQGARTTRRRLRS